MAPPNLLRKEQLCPYYQGLLHTLVPGWPKCLDEEVEVEEPIEGAAWVGHYSFPPCIFEASAIATLSKGVYPEKDFGIAVDACVTSNGKVYICDMVNMHRVVVNTPGKTGPLDQFFLKRNGKMAEFERAGAVMAVDNERMIVVKDMKGLHFFNAETDEFICSSEDIVMPYGLAMLADGSLATFSERQKSLVIVGIDGNIISEGFLDAEIVHDIETKTIPSRKAADGGMSGAKIRFMCSNVRKDGVEAVYMVDETGQRIYAVNVSNGNLIWTKNFAASCDIRSPKGIVSLPNGKLILALNRCNSLAVLNENGEFEYTLGTNSGVSKPQGMYLRQVGGKITLLVMCGLRVNSSSTHPCVCEYELPENLVG